MQAVASGLRMISAQTSQSREITLSIAIFAWNEERAIASTLESLFEQSLFEELSQRNACCEVVCVTNGCTDRTPIIAKEVFEQQQRKHPFARCFLARVAQVPERGKLNAWNKFVHEISAHEARYLVMMDADILIHRKQTLWNMVRTLERIANAGIAVDRPCKDIFFKRRRSFHDWFSLGMSQITLSSPAQLCAQLYCIRARSARCIYMPKDLPACEDGFIKSLICTDNLSHEVRSERIAIAPGAEHTFEAYTSPSAILKNQKRQVIGQTIIHLLIDRYLPGLSAAQLQDLAETLRDKDASDPNWLRRLTSEQLQRTRWFWRLYPGLVTHRFRRLSQLSPLKRVLCLPAACAATVATLLASFLAYRTLKRGSMDYWPKAERVGLQAAEPGELGLPLAKSTGAGR